MSTFKCKMCGGALEIKENESTATCEYCGSTQTLPKYNDEKLIRLSDRANHFRLNREYDKASKIYEQILEEDNTDAETYWALVLCRYGIVYVEDPASLKRMPTINRMQYTSIFDDENYKLAIEKADFSQKLIYEQEAAAINKIQKSILEISKKEAPYDVFICYKENDEMGNRTRDSVYANDIYHNLEKEGYRVFFARISLENTLGEAYEPIIFAALNSAKVMIAIGSKPEYFNAVWVKNEWSRFLSLIKKGAKKQLIPAYFDMDAYDLPEEFSHLQAQDMSKLGFMQDLIHGIKKILTKQTPQKKESSSLNKYIKQAKHFTDHNNFERAYEYCEKILELDANNFHGYFYRFLCTAECSEHDLINSFSHADIFMEEDYQSALSFANPEQLGYLKNIEKRVTENQLKDLYKLKEECEKILYSIRKKQYEKFIDKQIYEIQSLEKKINEHKKEHVILIDKQKKEHIILSEQLKKNNNEKKGYIEKEKSDLNQRKLLAENEYTTSRKKARKSLTITNIITIVIAIILSSYSNSDNTFLILNFLGYFLIGHIVITPFIKAGFMMCFKEEIYNDFAPRRWNPDGNALLQYIADCLLLSLSLGFYFDYVIYKSEEIFEQGIESKFNIRIRALDNELQKLKNDEETNNQAQQSKLQKLKNDEETNNQAQSSKLQQLNEQFDKNDYKAKQLLAIISISFLAKFKKLSDELSFRLNNLENENLDALSKECRDQNVQLQTNRSEYQKYLKIRPGILFPRDTRGMNIEFYDGEKRCFTYELSHNKVVNDITKPTQVEIIETRLSGTLYSLWELYSMKSKEGKTIYFSTLPDITLGDPFNNLINK